MRLRWKKGVVGSLTLALAFGAVAAGCAKSGGGTEGAPDNKAEEPAKPAKVRVMIYDRGNAPEGMSLKEAPLIKWAQEEVKKIGIDLEYVPVPRASAGEKLNVWMASGEAPDIVFTYDAVEFTKFAEQGGLWELDDLLNKYGQQILKNNKAALDVAGTYKGKRYAIPMIRANTYTGGGRMKIRKDWLDKLGLSVPTTTDELYEVLKAFKEKDPGNVGKDKVVPWLLGPIGTGSKGFLYGVGFGFGLNMDAPAAGGPDMPTGIYRDGAFTSHIATPEGKALLQFVNKAYKDGLISKEFATDANSQQLTQQIATGVAGFVDNNDDPITLNETTRKAVPDANWIMIEPFKRKDGTQVIGRAPAYGMFIMIPKTSKNPEAVVKYLNWMADPAVIKTLQSGIEGVHYVVENGIPKVKDQAMADKAAREVAWYAAPGDLAIIQQGQPPQTKEELDKLYADRPGYADSIWNGWEIFRKFGKPEPLLTMQRPFAQKNSAAIFKQLNESVSKAIIVDDFEKAYAELVSNWEKVGGREYDKELTEALKAAGK